MKVSPAAMIIVGDDALGVPLGGARLELSQTMPVYKDGRTFCPCICGDEVWIGEKFQSNPEIAGSPRNSFRASLLKE